MENKNPEKEKKPDKQKLIGMLMFEAGMEFAVSIAAPLIGAVYLGRWLQAKYDKDFFIIVCILAALALSSYVIAKRVNEYKKMLK